MTLEEEVRNGYTVPARMKRVWKVQMDLLGKLLEVCDKYGLKIWADGGTLLGAVREHGYIPWDDDIDMAMLREDYDKLIQVAPKEFDHPFFFQCGYSEKIYPLGHSKLRMDGTSAIEQLPALRRMHQGIFIDVFPYDSIPDDEETTERLFKERDRLFSRMQSINTFDILHPIRSIQLCRYRFSFHKVYKQYEDLCRSYSLDNCRNVSCISFSTEKHFIRDKHWYDETVWMPFEDIQMPVPVGYHQILTKQYGDYLVPRQGGSYHGEFWKLDPDKSYKEYLPEYRKYISRLTHERRLFRIKKFLRKTFYR